MKLDTAIYDMDGLLIDSEPLWHLAARDVMGAMGIPLDDEAYATTIGLRTREFLEHWFSMYEVDPIHLPETEELITRRVIELVSQQGTLMPGVLGSIELFRKKGFRIGLATSSPMALVEAMLARTGLGGSFHAISSAALLPYGKPHPQVYLDCAQSLGSSPLRCLCLEDSFNGMIAAKAARMKCIVVPESSVYHLERWLAADRILPSLEHMDAALLESLGG
ncbi:MAG: hexitol phosphatase HxpB [Chitinophagaceae bacterium]|jgi:sugar-phosphatase|nr:hexitol phosphatase HxpB [Chitinophagaceae bacterium]